MEEIKEARYCGASLNGRGREQNPDHWEKRNGGTKMSNVFLPQAHFYTSIAFLRAHPMDIVLDGPRLLRQAVTTW